jgi:hypothetical protein
MTEKSKLAMALCFHFTFAKAQNIGDFFEKILMYMSPVEIKNTLSSCPIQTNKYEATRDIPKTIFHCNNKYDYAIDTIQNKRAWYTFLMDDIKTRAPWKVLQLVRCILLDMPMYLLAYDIEYLLSIEERANKPHTYNFDMAEWCESVLVENTPQEHTRAWCDFILRSKYIKIKNAISEKTLMCCIERVAFYPDVYGPVLALINERVVVNFGYYPENANLVWDCYIKAIKEIAPKKCIWSTKNIHALCMHMSDRIVQDLRHLENK